MGFGIEEAPVLLHDGVATRRLLLERGRRQHRLAAADAAGRAGGDTAEAEAADDEEDQGERDGREGDDEDLDVVVVLFGDARGADDEEVEQLEHRGEGAEGLRPLHVWHAPQHGGRDLEGGEHDLEARHRDGSAQHRHHDQAGAHAPPIEVEQVAD